MHDRAESAPHNGDGDCHHGGVWSAGETGSYSMDVEPGLYRVTLNTEGYAPSYVGDILVKADSAPGTLNKFLMDLEDAQYYPKALAELEAVAAEILKRAEASAASAEEAKNGQRMRGDRRGIRGTPGRRVFPGQKAIPASGGQRVSVVRQDHRGFRV